MCGVSVVTSVSFTIFCVARTSALPSYAGITNRGLATRPPATSFVGGCFAKMMPTVVRSVAASPLVV